MHCVWALMAVLGAVELPSDTIPAFSCAFAISLDTNRPCSEECAAACQIVGGSEEHWALHTDFAHCVTSVPICAVPFGVKATLYPSSVASTFENQDPSIVGYKDTQWVKTDVVTFSGEELLKKVIDPMRLLYASLLITSVPPVDATDQCQYISLARDNVPQGNEPPFHHDVGTGYHCAGRRLRVDDGRNMAGSYRHTVNLVSLVQQWWLRRKESEPLRVRAVRYRVGGKSFNESNYALEVFSAYHWVNSVPPECTQRTNCTSCVVTSVCSWCDMSRAAVGDYHMLTGYHARSRTRRRDGSSCGIPATACALMGGDPFSENCRYEEDFLGLNE